MLKVRRKNEDLSVSHLLEFPVEEGGENRAGT